MAFKIPFVFSSTDKIKRRNSSLRKLFKHKKHSSLQTYLENTNSNLTREEYLAICLGSFIYKFIFISILLSISLYLIQIENFGIWALGVSFLISIFTLSSQLLYPKVYFNRKQREIERNLIPCLEDMLVQLNSGIPLFSILVNISSSGYGALSEEFKLAVKKINSGSPQVEVLEEIGDKNPSPYFRRALWQISNGMRAGSDISIVVKESIKSLNQEQILQIQNYGNKLNPIIMFYMLITVILPALALTFFTIIASMINLPSSVSIPIFLVLGFSIMIIQIMFLGTIKSLRPSLI